MVIPEKAFASLLVMTVQDFLQLLPAREKLIFLGFSDKASMKQLSGLQLWHLFKCEELTEVVQENDEQFMNMLNKI